MPDSATPLAETNLILAVIASLTWAVGLLMALPRYRAFRQRSDLWWALAFACLVVVGVGHGLESSAWRGADVPGDATVLHVVARVAFALAAAAAVQGYRRRTDAFD